MYCGSCSRDNALAVELIARGHDVTLLPLYTPTNPDEPNVSRDRVLFGGISIYLQQHMALFRKTPRFLDRLWDSPTVIRSFASRSISTDPKLLGDLTVSMLEGDRGVLRKEFDKLRAWLADEPVPDLVNLSNSLLISLARPLRDALKRPICCTLQGEDLFLDDLIEPYRGRAIELIRRQVVDVDRFIAVSEYYVAPMARLLNVAPERIDVVPLGINLDGYAPARPPLGHATSTRPTRRFASDTSRASRPKRACTCWPRPIRSSAGAPATRRCGSMRRGTSRARTRRISQTIKSGLEKAGVAGDFTYHGAVDRAGKLAFLQTLDVLSVPTPYDEPKGVFLLEALASGVPVVQPRRGAFPEIVEKTGGGLLVTPDDPAGARRRAVQAVERSPAGATPSASAARSASGCITAFSDRPIGCWKCTNRFTDRPRNHESTKRFHSLVS